MYYKEERRIRIQGHVHCAIGNLKKSMGHTRHGNFGKHVQKKHITYTTYLPIGTMDKLTKTDSLGGIFIKFRIYYIH